MKIKDSIEQAAGVANEIQEFAKSVRPQFSRRPMLKTVPFWVAACLAGFFCVGYAVFFDLIAETAPNILGIHPLFSLLFSPACFVLSWLIVYKMAPNASGSGIPQVMAASKLTHRNSFEAGDNLLSLKTAMVKVLSSLVCVLGGGAVGREGPTIQISASIFYFIGRNSKFFFRELSMSPFIIAGGAAGVAAAFNTPLGGIVFAIEELARNRFHIVKGVLILAVVVAGVISQLMLGPYLYFGFPQIPPATVAAFPLCIIVGVFGGFLGAVFGKLLQALLIAKNKRFKTPKQLAGFAAFCGIFIVALSYFAGVETVGPGKHLITGLLFESNEISWWTAIGRFFASIVSYLSGCAGGIFAPSLATGAAIGQNIATLFEASNVTVLVLSGMIAFLTGVTKAPFTSFVLVLEMTDRHSAILFMMIAAMMAHAISQLIVRKSFYEVMEDYYISKNRKTKKNSTDLG